MKIKDLPPNKGLGGVRFRYPGDGKNGPNTTNCSFSIFSCKERTQRWERGKADGEKARQGATVL